MIRRIFYDLIESLAFPDNTRSMYGPPGFEPCTVRHPEYFLLCGNWPYARQRGMYPAGHAELHTVVGRVPLKNGLGYYDTSAEWRA